MTQIISAIATTASIVSLAFSDMIPRNIRLVILFVGLASFIYLIFVEIQKNSTNERICTSQSEVNSAMKDIIKSQGKICIMSRDLSWVTDDIAHCLEEKKDSILIFAQSQNATTQKLSQKGIKVKYYAHLGFEPKTRFTIIRYNRTNPQVAIANVENSIRKKNKFKHIIYETSSDGSRQDTWINSLAVDMVTLCNLVFKEENDDKKDRSQTNI